MGLGVEAFFERDPGAALAGAVFAVVGFLLLMLALKAGPAPPGTRRIELARHYRARRGQWLCFSIGFLGLGALKVAGSLEIRWVARWLPPASHTLTTVFTCIWIAGFGCNVFASYYLEQANQLGGSRGGEPV
jgi:hypothetical protein